MEPEPGLERSLAGEGADLLVGADESILCQIVGQGVVATHALQHRPHQALVAPDQLSEGRRIPGGDHKSNKFLIRRRHRPGPSQV